MSTYADLWNQRQVKSESSSGQNVRQPDDSSRQGPVVIFLDDDQNQFDGHNEMESMDLDVQRTMVARQSVQTPGLSPPNRRPHKRLPSSPDSVSSITGKCCVVVDTNVFVQDLQTIKDAVHEMTTARSNFDGGIHLVVPYVVLSELDHLKDAAFATTNPQPSTSDQASRVSARQTAYAARTAINWLLSLIRGNSPYVIVQNEAVALYGRDQLFVNATPEMRATLGQSNDDMILGSCRSLTENANQVRLLTNDRSLALKAFSYKIRSLAPWEKCTGKELYETFKRDFRFEETSKSPEPGGNEASGFASEMEVAADNDMSIEETDMILELAMLINKHLSPPLRSHLLKTLARDDVDVFNYMVPALADLEMVPVDNPCKRAQQVVSILRKYWRAADIQDLYQWDLRPQAGLTVPQPKQSIHSADQTNRLHRLDLDKIAAKVLPNLERVFNSWTPESKSYRLSLGDKMTLISDAERVLLGTSLLPPASRERAGRTLDTLL